MVWLNLDLRGPPSRVYGLNLMSIRSLSVVKDACNFGSTKHSIHWYLRLHLKIKLTKMDLDPNVDHYLGLTFDTFPIDSLDLEGYLTYCITVTLISLLLLILVN